MVTWLCGGRKYSVTCSTSSTETFLGTATKGVSLYYCYLHCKGSLPFKCGKGIRLNVFAPTGKQEDQENACTAEEEPMLISCTRVQRGRFWGIRALYRTPVSSASRFTHGSKPDGGWMSLHQKTLTKTREDLKTKTLETSKTNFLWGVTDAGSLGGNQLPAVWRPLP